MTTDPESMAQVRARADSHDGCPTDIFDRALAAHDARVRADAIRRARLALAARYDDPPTLDGAGIAERVGARHATNLCMDFLTQFADALEEAR